MTQDQILSNISRSRCIIETGYYHPSNANWAYHIFMIIDDKGARLYKSTFGSDYNLRAKFDDMTLLTAGKGSGVQYKWRDIKDLPDVVQYTGKNWGEGSFGGDK
jgi:hypothetical protein